MTLGMVTGTFMDPAAQVELQEQSKVRSLGVRLGDEQKSWLLLRDGSLTPNFYSLAVNESKGHPAFLMATLALFKHFVANHA